MRLNPFRRRPPVPADGAMPFVAHLAELRRRLIIAIFALLVGMAIAFFLYNRTLSFLVHPYCSVKHQIQPGSVCKLVVTDPLDGIAIRLKLMMYEGLLIASPVVLWQLWRFITPGLYDREKRYAVPFVASSVLLFILGAALALVTFPKALQFFASFGGQNLELLYTPGKYLGLLTVLMLIFGIAFEFPIVLVFLQLAGILKWRQLASWRRYAIVGIFVVDAVITPSGDPYTLIAMAVPMCLFYEASILIGRFVLKK